ncbi:MAG: glycerophosphoryl diester phosphodiesterase membrane domain-containing protein [Roseiflexaceae bacterium]
MPEQHDEDNDARESHARRRLHMAEQLAEQLRASPQPSQPPVLAAERPATVGSAPPPRPATVEEWAVKEISPIQAAPPPAIDVEGPLLQEFMDSTGHFRQLSLGDLLDATFRIYRRRFGTFVTITAVVLVPMMLIQLLLNWLSNSPISGQLIQNSFVVGQSSFISPLIGATLIYYVARIPSDATRPVAVAYSAGLRRYLALLAAGLLEEIVIVIPALLVVGCLFAVFLRGNTSSGSTQIVLLVVLVLLLLPIFTRFALVNQAVVLEQCRAMASLRRSWQLTSGWFWRTFWVSTCAAILAYLIGALPAVGVNFVLGLSGADAAAALAPSITIILSQAGEIFALPLQIIISTLLYYDLRMRREGYDLEVLAQVSG